MFLKIQEFLKSTNLLNATYHGIVVDNVDPLKLKRVKVQVEGLMVGEPEKLPWVYQEESSSLGNNATTGVFAVPKVDSIVEVFFPNGDIYSPRYRNRYDETVHQVEFDTNYPDKWGIIDDGFKFLVDRIESSITVNHPSGTKVTILEDGTINLTTPKELNITTTDKVDVTASKDITVNSSTNVKVTAGSDLELDGSGGKVKLSGGKVGIGAGQELVDLVEQIATTLSTDLANLGIPLANASQYASIAGKLSSIKGGV